MIAKGSYSSVYIQDGFAIKKMKSKSSFIREITFLDLLDHPNIIKILEFNYNELSTKMHFYEYTLFYLVKDNITFDKNLVLKEILKGLNYIHKKGIIHCDLNPNNILINLDPFEVVISDFNLSTFESVCPKRGPVQTDGFVAPNIYLIKEAYYKRKDDKELMFINYTFDIDIWTYGCLVLFINNIVDRDLYFYQLKENQVLSMNISDIHKELVIESMIKKSKIKNLLNVFKLEDYNKDIVDLTNYSENEILILTSSKSNLSKKNKHILMKEMANRIIKSY